MREARTAGATSVAGPATTSPAPQPSTALIRPTIARTRAPRWRPPIRPVRSFEHDQLTVGHDRPVEASVSDRAGGTPAGCRSSRPRRSAGSRGTDRRGGVDAGGGQRWWLRDLLEAEHVAVEGTGTVRAWPARLERPVPLSEFGFCPPKCDIALVLGELLEACQRGRASTGSRPPTSAHGQRQAVEDTDVTRWSPSETASPAARSSRPRLRVDRPGVAYIPFGRARA
jgi:hypothetical protein